MHLPRFLFLSIVFMTITAANIPGQNISATLNGTVRDVTGAVIPGASVTISRVDTAATRVVHSNADGYFAFPDLLPGMYALSVELPGFKTYRQMDIRLTAGEIRTLGDIRMELGQLSDIVTVEASEAAVELSSGEKSGVISGEELDQTALRGRDFLDMLRLLPGVVDDNTGREAPGPDNIRSLWINGGRENSKNMTVDGVTNLDTGSNNTTHMAPTIDTIAEVKVLTSNYQAEFGRNTGGTIIVTTKGGSQQYHGGASFFYRNEAFNAGDYFDNRNGVAKPPYRYNIGGWQVGGPVIPRKRKNATLFFFFSQEFQRQKVNYGTRTVRVPTALERQGDFSKTFDVNNRQIVIYDPATRQAFPGNVIPKERQDALGQAILNMFPMPNFVDPSPSRVNQWNYIVSAAGNYPRRSELIRVDYNPSSRLQTYIRYTQDADSQNRPYGMWYNGSTNYDLGSIRFNQPGKGVTINVTRTIGRTFVNQFIAGFSRNRLTSFPSDLDALTRSGRKLPIPQWYPDNNPLGLIPNMDFGGVSNWANPSLHNGLPYNNSNNIISLVENLSKVQGRHALRAGVYMERTGKNQLQAATVRGEIGFNDDTNSPQRTRWAYANALMGLVTSYSEANTRPYGLYRFTNLEWYLQDNWRVNRRLALDIGMRFYHDLPQSEVRGQTAAFVPELWDPARAPVMIVNGRDAKGNRVGVDPRNGTVYAQGLVGTFVPGVGDPANGMVLSGTRGYPMSLYTMPGLSLGPRFGFAFDPFGKGKTALRGGFGLFYDRIAGNPTMGMITNPPTVNTPTVYYTTLEEFAKTAGGGVLAPTSIGGSLFGKGRMPSTFNFSLGIQQTFGRGTKLDVSYVGSVSRHLLYQRNINAVPPGSTLLTLHPENRDPITNNAYSTNFLRPYRGYGDIFVYDFGGTANYNSMQVGFMQRAVAGLQIRASYTFAKTLGVAQGDSFRVSPFFDRHERNYGRLNFDRDHVFTMNYTWRAPKSWLPAIRPVRMLLDNWELSGTTMFSRGAPFMPGYSLVNGVNFAGTPSEPNSSNSGARIIWLGGTNFARPGPVRASDDTKLYWGNAGWGILRGPGINNWDLRLTRRFPLFSEKQWLEFRGEAFNAFNHTQFSGLDTTARFDDAGSQINPLFLTPTGSRTPRRMQFSVKIYW